MKTFEPTAQGRKSGSQAFTLIEVMMSVVVIAIAVTTIYATIVTAYSMTAISRENLRATQIMLDKMEGVKLYTWNQVTNAGTSSTNFLRTTFTNWFYETNYIGEWNAVGNGVQYVGTVSVGPISTYSNVPYANNMVEVDVNISWNSSGNGWYRGSLTHSRSMSTYVASDGTQPYIYNSN